VKKVGCFGDLGASCIAIITEDNRLWTAGDGVSHMLGRETVKPRNMTGLSSTYTVPELVPTLEGTEVLEVYGGLGQHMAAIVVGQPSPSSVTGGSSSST